MSRPTGLGGIAFCHFARHYRDGRRRFRIRRAIFLGGAPVLFGVAFAVRLGMPSGDRLTLIVAVLSVLAAVLVGLLPLAHSILAQADSMRKFDQGQREIANQEIARVEVLQDLHASISWAVVLLVVGLACGAILAMLPSAGTPGWAEWTPVVQYLLIAILYSVMTSTALTFFDVATGIFEAMESHATSIKTRIGDNVSRKGGPDVEL